MIKEGDRHSHLPILEGDEARSIDLEVSERLGRMRVLEAVATRIADMVAYHLGLSRDGSCLLFVAGKGNNGANAIAAARMLHLRGWNVRVVPLVELQPADGAEGDGRSSGADGPSPASGGGSYSFEGLRPNMKEQLELYAQFVGTDRLHPSDWDRIRLHGGVIVDGILGTGIRDPPRGVSLWAIRAISEAAGGGGARVLSIDMPSGLNHVTGRAPDACVEATWTINLHMLKRGQLAGDSGRYVGELWSAETALGFVTFPGSERFMDFYRDGPIRRVELGE